MRVKEGYALGVLIRVWRALYPFARQPRVQTDLERAIALIEALDRGGVVSDSVRVNAIARSLGLDVSPRAPVTETVQRIRAAVERAQTRGYD